MYLMFWYEGGMRFFESIELSGGTGCCERITIYTFIYSNLTRTDSVDIPTACISDIEFSTG